MALLFVDTSALVKLYINEVGTSEMLQLVDPQEGHKLAILGLARVEFRAALGRRERMGDIDNATATTIIQSFSGHLATIFQVQPLNEGLLDLAEIAIDRHGLRAHDAMQLAGCLALRQTVGAAIDLRFVASDQALLTAAVAEGFTAINPESP